MTEYFQDEIGARSFTELTDSPSSYTGQGGKAVFVKGTEDGLELSDVPSPAVTINELTDVDTTGKSAGRILEFDASGNMVVGDKSATASTAFTSLTDTPSSYAGNAGNVATVNPTEDGIIFSSVAGGGLVDSVFGRIGAVTAQAGDYNSNLVNNSSAVVGSSVTAALNTVNTSLTNINNALDDKMDKLGAGTSGNLLIRDTLGNAADSGVAFTNLATAAQGALADSAVQPEDLATVATTGNYADLVNTPYDLHGSTQDLIAYNGVTSAGDLWVANKGYSGDGRGVCTWVATSTTGQTPSQPPAVRGRAELTDADGRIWRLLENNINVDMLGAAEDGDVTAAINAAFGEVRNSYVSDATGFMTYGEASVSFSARTYEVSSINATYILGPRNTFIYGNGCTLKANTSGKSVFDAIGSRWLWVHDVTIRSDEAVKARAGLIIGNRGTETCGNNKFYNLQCLGDYQLAPMVNMGSETTQWYSCRFSNESTDTSTYAAYCDGSALIAYTSDYVTVTRQVGERVSFTNNRFYGCQFRHIGGGSSVFLTKASKWSFDEGCYFLAYAGAGIVAYSSALSTNEGISVTGGLFETQQTSLPNGTPVPGMEYCVYIIGNGEDTALSGWNFKSASAHNTSAIIGTDGSTGIIRLSLWDLKITGVRLYGANKKVFEQVNTQKISFKGNLDVDAAEYINLDDLINFNGRIITDDEEKLVTPPSGSSYIASFTTSVNNTINGLKRVSYGAFNNATISGNDLSVKSRMNVFSTSVNSVVTGFTRPVGEFFDAEEVFVRFSGSGSLTFTAGNNIRTLSGNDIVLLQDDVAQFVRVTGNVWQQTGGKV